MNENDFKSPADPNLRAQDEDYESSSSTSQRGADDSRLPVEKYLDDLATPKGKKVKFESGNEASARLRDARGLTIE